MDREQVIDEVMAVVAPNGEAESGIYRFQVGLLLKDAVKRTLVSIIAGNFPDGGVSPYSDGVSGNESDISNLQKHLHKAFYLEISSAGVVDLGDALNDPEPMVLNTPFISIQHVGITSKLSAYVPDEDELNAVSEIYGTEMLVYTVTDYFGIVAEPPPYPPTLKRILIRPETLTGYITVVSYYLPSLEKLPDVFKPYVVTSVISLLGLGQQRKK